MSKSQAAAQMAAAASLRGAASWLRGSRRNALLVLLSVGLLGFAALEAWKKYGASHAHMEAYSVPLQGYDISPPPSWVSTTIKSDVIRLGSLEGISLLEADTSRRVAQAFELHPWVAKVQRVSKRYPASIGVELEYRRPVAVVEVSHGDQPGLLPVDGEGILLPPEDFSLGQVKSLPRITVGQTFPAGSIGTAWDDERVTAAAAIAQVLCEDWSRFPLYQIAAVPSVPGSAQRATQFEIVARDGRRFFWGSAPNSHEAGATTAAEKRAQLLQWLDQE